MIFEIYGGTVGSPKFGEYKIKPSFKVDFDNKLNLLEALRRGVDKMIQLCPVSRSEKLRDICVRQFTFDEKNLQVTTSRDGDSYFFDVENLHFVVNIPLKHRN